MKVCHSLAWLPLPSSLATSLGPTLRRAWCARLGLLAVLLSKSAAFAAGPEIAIEQAAGVSIGSSVVAWGDNREGQTTVPPGLTDVQAVAAGDTFTVALKGDGTIAMWGDNRFGQTNIPSAAQSEVQSVAAGFNHTVALKRDGTVVVWGNDDFGKSTVPLAARSGMRAVAAGYHHTVALTAAGTVVAWGSDSEGQATVPVEAQSGVQAIAAGDFHTVALKTDGSVIAWGWSIHGQTTVPVAAQSGVQAIAAGNFHTVALKTDGSVVAWGRSFDGQTAVPAGLSGVQAIAAGGYHTVALKGDGSVVGWGRNANGQQAVPGGLTSVAGISGGESHTVALRKAAVDFGGLIAGATSTTKTFTIKNTGDAALGIGSVIVLGGNAADFTVETADTLSALPPAGATTFRVTFHPSATGPRTTTLRVLSDDADEGTFDIALDGAGVTLPPEDDTGFTLGTKAIDLDVLANDPGLNRSTAVLTFPTPPRYGAVRIVGGKVRYLPGRVLPLAGDTFTYQYDDGQGGTGTGTVTIGNLAAIAGEYDGLIVADPAATGEERHRQSGHLRVLLSKTGVFTGRVTFAGTLVSPTGQTGARRFAFLDRLDSAGNSTRTIQHRTTQRRTDSRLPPITLALHFDAETQTFTGTATTADGTSALTLEKRTAAGASAGKYTVQIQPDAAPGAPDGPGAARLKIARNGSIITVGRLPDGAPFSSSALLHADRTFPLYAALYAGEPATRGSMRGTMQLPGALAQTSTLDWFKPVRSSDRFFPEGFTVNAVAGFVD